MPKMHRQKIGRLLTGYPCKTTYSNFFDIKHGLCYCFDISLISCVTYVVQLNTQPIPSLQGRGRVQLSANHRVITKDVKNGNYYSYIMSAKKLVSAWVLPWPKKGRNSLLRTELPERGRATIELVVYRTFDQRIMHMMIARLDLRYTIIINPRGVSRPCRESVIWIVLLVTILSLLTDEMAFMIS